MKPEHVFCCNCGFESEPSITEFPSLEEIVQPETPHVISADAPSSIKTTTEPDLVPVSFAAPAPPEISALPQEPPVASDAIPFPDIPEGTDEMDVAALESTSTKHVADMPFPDVTQADVESVPFPDLPDEHTSDVVGENNTPEHTVNEGIPDTAPPIVDPVPFPNIPEETSDISTDEQSAQMPFPDIQTTTTPPVPFPDIPEDCNATTGETNIEQKAETTIAPQAEGAVSTINEDSSKPSGVDLEKLLESRRAPEYCDMCGEVKPEDAMYCTACGCKI